MIEEIASGQARSPEFVLYHADCNDGFGAAWAAWKSLSDNATYIPVQYGEPIPLGRIPVGAQVYILDFSYDRETLLSLNQRSNQVIVIDHHKTAREALEGLSTPGLSITFDMDKSGAMLAWEHFHPGEKAPVLIQYVQDRDLWTWKLNLSREFSAALSVEPKDFNRWNELEVSLTSFAGQTEFLARGEAVLAATRQHVESLASKAHWVKIAGHRVPAVNSPLFQSEIGERLCELHPEAPFAAVFFVLNPDEEVWSLRSRNDFDVSSVARTFGGGGHPAAAGFKVRRKCSPGLS